MLVSLDLSFRIKPMKYFMRTLPFYLSLCICVFLTSALQAQNKRKIQARTLCFSRVADQPDIFISVGEGVHQIMLPIHRHSPEFTCIVSDNRAVFFKEDGNDAEGKPKRVAVAEAKVPAAARKVLFYFIPTSKPGKMLYNVRVMNDDLRAFPMGHTRALNLFGGEVGFQFGEHLKRMKPGSLVNIPPVKKKNAYNMAPVMCRMMTKDGTWRTISETQMRFTQRKRLLVVSFVDPSTRRPRLRFYKDIPPVKEPAAPPAR